MQQWISGNRAETLRLCDLETGHASSAPWREPWPKEVHVWVAVGGERWERGWGAVGKTFVTGAKCAETRLRVAAAIRHRSKERPKATTFSRALYEIELSPVMSLSD